MFSKATVKALAAAIATEQTRRATEAEAKALVTEISDTLSLLQLAVQLAKADKSCDPWPLPCRITGPPSKNP